MYTYRLLRKGSTKYAIFLLSDFEEVPHIFYPCRSIFSTKHKNTTSLDFCSLLKTFWLIFGIIVEYIMVI